MRFFNAGTDSFDEDVTKRDFDFDASSSSVPSQDDTSNQFTAAAASSPALPELCIHINELQNLLFLVFASAAYPFCRDLGML